MVQCPAPPPSPLSDLVVQEAEQSAMLASCSRNCDGSDADFAKMNELDALMCRELQEEARPALPCYGLQWFEMR